MQRDSFIFYRSFAKALKHLPNDDRLKIFDAITNYSLDGEEPELEGISLGFWELIKPQLQANNKRFSNGAKGGEYGSKGGRPKKETPNDENNNPYGVSENNPKETPNNNNNVNENVNENDLKEKIQKENFDFFDKNFYSVYPGKGNKKQSFALWEKLTTTQQRECLARLPSYLEYCKVASWYQPKDPETFLNAKKEQWNADWEAKTELEKAKARGQPTPMQVAQSRTEQHFQKMYSAQDKPQVITDADIENLKNIFGEKNE